MNLYMATDEMVCSPKESIEVVTKLGKKDTSLKMIGYNREVYAKDANVSAIVTARVTDYGKTMETISEGVDHVKVKHLIVYARARRHRKARIDKKWRKRYGYVEVTYVTRTSNGSISIEEDDEEAQMAMARPMTLTILPRGPVYTAIIDMEAIEHGTEKRRVTCDEYEALRKESFDFKMLCETMQKRQRLRR